MSSVKSALTATVRNVARKKLIPTRDPLILTQAAIDRIKDLMKDKPDMLGLKIGVRTRGCNGLSYTLDYCKEKAKFDEVVSKEGISVIIDSKAQLTLLGTEMDFVTHKLGSEFVFNNPNVKGMCGCGESFNV
ncbi:iron-sulfur cluster assembly 1 homolog, mitochondrial-like [Tubulanus polymorphus]|uniref:iron-sulfur cluster assembly 1 homolog, mitochondrial-like n=1 Tax=Tubulanus polymorphus TaxID=672921 RepID=UPI003DA6C188